MQNTEVNVEGWTEEVRDALAEVCDPELDESIIALGFVQEIAIRSTGDVCVRFHLPTYWCSANFAYLMAVDMRDAIARLPWAGKIDIELLDHFTSEAVSDGASSHKAFQESFPSEADEGLEEVRLIFRRKSFQKRQELLLRHLLSRKIADSSLIAMRAAHLRQLDLGPEGDNLRVRYLRARNVLGHGSMDLAFHDVEGKPLEVESFAEYLLSLRRVRLNTEFNSEMCRGLLEVRYGSRREDGLVQIDGTLTRAFSTNEEAPSISQADESLSRKAAITKSHELLS